MSFVNLSCNPIKNWSKKQTDAIEKYCSEDSAIFCLANNTICLKDAESIIPGGFCAGMTILIERRVMSSNYLAYYLQNKGCTVVEADYDNNNTFIKFIECPSIVLTPERKAEMTFINLTNHPVSSWSNEMKEAAKQFYTGTSIRCFAESMPIVDPAMSESELKELACNIFSCLGGELPGVAYKACTVLVQTDFTLAYLLVQILQSEGCKVVAATTSRQLVEVNKPDGSVERKSVFKFVRFREYENLFLNRNLLVNQDLLRSCK